MSDRVRVAVVGVSGRMGQTLVSVLAEDGATDLVAATEREGHDWLGRSLSDLIGTSAPDLFVSAYVEAAARAADVLIDFTAPAATLAHAEICAGTQTGHVIGTTGFSEEELARLEAMADRVAMVRAGNMSLGVNLLVELTRQVAAALDEAFDIEVIEAHHRHKVDAPSGTALMLGEAAAEGRGVDLAEVADRARDGITGAREEGHIGFSVIRGGDIVGEHDVLFAAPGERITLRHQATDRALFARGAVRAAKWVAGKPPGAYQIKDVLGL